MWKENIGRFDKELYRNRIDKFQKRYGGFEDEKAGERVAEVIEEHGRIISSNTHL